MTLTWSSLLLLCLAGALVWFWQNSLAARELANRTAMEACESLALQFLDGTVAFARIGLGRGSHGRLVLRRTYVFDYTSNSIERRQGFVVISERSVEAVGYAQEDENRASAERARAERARVKSAQVAEPPVERTAESARVVHLSERRNITESPAQPEDRRSDWLEPRN